MDSRPTLNSTSSGPSSDEQDSRTPERQELSAIGPDTLTSCRPDIAPAVRAVITSSTAAMHGVQRAIILVIVMIFLIIQSWSRRQSRREPRCGFVAEDGCP